MGFCDAHTHPNFEIASFTIILVFFLIFPMADSEMDLGAVNLKYIKSMNGRTLLTHA